MPAQPEESLQPEGTPQPEESLPPEGFPLVNPCYQLFLARRYPHPRAKINLYNALCSASDEHLPVVLRPTECANYARYADEAYFASDARRARCARRADRIVPCPPGLQLQGSLDEFLVQAPTHESLLERFEKAHSVQPSQNAKVAELASHATDAVFAEHAEEAYQALEIIAPEENL